MKIIVNKVPEKPEDCLFSKRGFSGCYCSINNGYLCKMHTLNKCDRLLGIDRLASIELMPSPAYKDPEWIEHDIRIKEDTNA